MTKSGGKPAVTKVRPQDLRTIAELIRRYAKEYDDAADEMESAGIEVFPATGITALENNVLKLLAGNSSTLKRKIQIEVNAIRMTEVAGNPANYVVDEPKPKTGRGRKQTKGKP